MTQCASKQIAFIVTLYLPLGHALGQIFAEHCTYWSGYMCIMSHVLTHIEPFSKFKFQFPWKRVMDYIMRECDWHIFLLCGKLGHGWLKCPPTRPIESQIGAGEGSPGPDAGCLKLWQKIILSIIPRAPIWLAMVLVRTYKTVKTARLSITINTQCENNNIINRSRWVDHAEIHKRLILGLSAERGLLS